MSNRELPKVQPATPDSEFDSRNPNRHRLLVVTPENADALAKRARAAIRQGEA